MGGESAGVDTSAVPAGVRGYFANLGRLQGETVTIVATGVAADGAAIVIFTVHAGGRPVGVHVDLDEFTKLFEPNTAEVLPQVVSDEIAEPAGTGELRDVDWADRLVGDPQSVGRRRI
ncbi:MAG: hypothetical protein H7146_05780 [Burkholderiaceae bacterium]|nr:hypothetical protein [Microbacteriaceae bacterium]